MLGLDSGDDDGEIFITIRCQAHWESAEVHRKTEDISGPTGWFKPGSFTPQS